jgi:hypothetical protein
MAARMTLRQEILAAFGCGAVVGGITGYFVAENRLRTKYNQIADDEIEHMKDFYREKEMELLDEQKKIANQPKPDLDKVRVISEREGYLPPKEGLTEVEPEEGEEEETEDENAFVDLPGWNYDQQLAGRTADKPFIMHLEEYQQSECSHQVTITYFEGDDVLIDESDEVISKKDEVVGMENLAKFGFGSGDRNVVYVRNPKLDIEYEILRHQGHYSKEILGLEEEHLEHSAMPRRHKKFDDGT